MAHARSLLGMLCAACLCATGVAGHAQTAAPTVAPGYLVSKPERVDLTPGDETPGGQLTVGLQTPLTGAFALPGWSNDASDMEVRVLLQGCETVSWSSTQSLQVNYTVVSDIQVSDSAGTQTYTVRLADGLAFSDGTPILAQHYLFTLLLESSQAFAAVGGQLQRLAHIDGFDPYARGESETFSGLRLLDAHTFSITITPELSSYFYGLAAIYATPTPIHVIAPGCAVVDDGDGARIAGDGSGEGAFSQETLRQTLLGDGEGYLYKPSVTSGPYTLESFDPQTGEALLTANPHYPGNHEGEKPSIERLRLRYVPSGEIIQALQSGQIDLAVRVSDTGAVQAGTALMRNESGFAAPAYLRSGFTFLAFACEEEPTASQSVRRALAMALDCDTLTATAGGPTAARVYGYYGLGQWMTLQLMARDPTKPLEDPEELAALAVPHDPAAANTLLDMDGWTLNAQGGSYNPQAGDIRHRLGATELEPLTLHFAKSEGNAAAEAVLPFLQDAADALGMELTVTEMPFAQMLRHYYRQEDRVYNLFFLGTDFSLFFDPHYDFHTEDAFNGIHNTTGLSDAGLADAARRMHDTPSGQRDAYLAHWLDFQARFVELMPMIPLYSTVYIDFHTVRLRGYDVQNHPNWATAILYADLSE